jgi:hypothetical protein
MASHGASAKEEKFGQDLGLMHEALITGRKVGAGREFWSRLAHDEKFFRKMMDLHDADMRAKEALEALIEAGKYDWVHGEITADHFPPEDDDVTDLERLEVVHLNKSLTTEQVLSELDHLGFRPAKLRGLLTYGAKNSEERRNYTIVALGSGFVDSDGDREVPCLPEGSDGRKLGLRWNRQDGEWRWADDTRFLAIRK